MKKLTVLFLGLLLSITLCEPAWAVQFTDVPLADPDAPAISDITDRGIAGGQNGYFASDRNVTRAEATKFIANTVGLDCSSYENTEPAFNDTAEAHGLKQYIACFVGNGFASGYGDGNFGPQNPVLLHEFMKMLYRASGIYVDTANPPLYQNLSDASLTPFIQIALNHSVFPPLNNNEVPSLALKRRDVARYLFNFINYADTNNPPGSYQIPANQFSWTAYNSYTDNFSVTYPPSWRYEEDDFGTAFYPPGENEDGWGVMVMYDLTETIEELIEGLYAELVSEHGQSNTQKIEDSYIIDGKFASKVMMSTPDMRIELVFVKNQNAIFIIGGNNNFDLLPQFWNTFKFTASTQQGFETYNNYDYNYSLEFPQAWFLTEDLEETMITALDEDDVIKAMVSIVVLEESYLEDDDADDEELTKEYLEDMLAEAFGDDYYNIEILTFQESTLMNKPTLRYTFTATESASGDTLKIMQLLLADDAYFYVLTFVSEKNDFSSYSGTFEKMISSFRLL